MTLARLEVNGDTLCEVIVDVPSWLPVRPRLNRVWLRGLLVTALRHYLVQRIQPRPRVFSA